jgi:hypothetical protein
MTPMKLADVIDITRPSVVTVTAQIRHVDRVTDGVERLRDRVHAAAFAG